MIYLYFHINGQYSIQKKKRIQILAIIHTFEKNIHLYLHVQYLNTVRFFFVIKRTIFIFRHKKIVYAQKKQKNKNKKKQKHEFYLHTWHIQSKGITDLYLH